MAISAKKFKVPGIRLPITEAPAPSVSGLRPYLGRWVDVVDVKRPHVGEAALSALATERFDQRQLTAPIARMPVRFGTMKVPVVLLASRCAELGRALCAALLAGSRAAPSGFQVAGSPAVFPGPVSEPVGVHLGLRSAVSACDLYWVCSHAPTLSTYAVNARPRYFDIACRRIEEASKQADLFIEPAPAPKQETMAL